MSITKPFYRTCRQFTNGSYHSSYIEDPEYAKEPSHYIRAYELIQKDLIHLFGYVEPSDQNLDCYSFRIHELLLRACVEIEANFKAILNENGYSDCNTKGEEKKRTIVDYKKTEGTHYLSKYLVKIPNWTGSKNIIQPFLSFASQETPDWYNAYNETKHDRHEKFKNAKFGFMIHAVSALLVLLSAQFHRHDFSSGDTLLAINSTHGDNMDSAIGGYFRIKFPDFPNEMQYDFKWQELRNEEIKFQKINWEK